MFAFAIIMQEVFSHTITSAIVVAPTHNPDAAELYAFKVKLKLQHHAAAAAAAACHAANADWHISFGG